MVLYMNILPFTSAYRKKESAQYVTQYTTFRQSRENLDKNYVVEGVLMDLSKGFHCVPRHLLLAKLEAFGVDENFVNYIH